MSTRSKSRVTWATQLESRGRSGPSSRPVTSILRRGGSCQEEPVRQDSLSLPLVSGSECPPVRERIIETKTFIPSRAPIREEYVPYESRGPVASRGSPSRLAGGHIEGTYGSPVISTTRGSQIQGTYGAPMVSTTRGSHIQGTYGSPLLTTTTTRTTMRGSQIQGTYGAPLLSTSRGSQIQGTYDQVPDSRALSRSRSRSPTRSLSSVSRAPTRSPTKVSTRLSPIQPVYAPTQNRPSTRGLNPISARGTAVPSRQRTSQIPNRAPSRGFSPYPTKTITRGLTRSPTRSTRATSQATGRYGSTLTRIIQDGAQTFKAAFNPAYESSTILPQHDLSYYGEPSEERLGGGAFGTVWGYGDIALKVFDPLEQSPVFRSDTLREISVMIRCNHPNIVEIKDVLVMEHTLGAQVAYEVGLAMPRAQGSLMDMIYDTEYWKGLPDLYLIEIARDLVATLAYLHSRGIVHRDIKPGNILIYERSDGLYDVKYADFGLAMTYGCIVPKGWTEMVYTIWYVAPEILNRNLTEAQEQKGLGSLEAHYTQKADVWALGATLFEWLSGRQDPLFAPEDPNFQPELQLRSYYDHVLELATNRSYAAHLQIPQSASLIESMLVINPDHRPEAVELLFSTSLFDQIPRNAELDRLAVIDGCETRLGIRTSQPILPENVEQIPYVDATTKTFNTLRMIVLKNELNEEIYHHAIWIFDAYVSTLSNPLRQQTEFDLYGFAALGLASTYAGTELTSQDLANSLQGSSFSTSDISRATVKLMAAINYDIVQMTTWNYLDADEHGQIHASVLYYLYVTTLTTLRFFYSPEEIAELAQTLAWAEMNQRIVEALQDPHSLDNRVLQENIEIIRQAFEMAQVLEAQGSH